MRQLKKKPGNVKNWDTFLNKMEKTKEWYTEVGGIAYEILEASGLDSAYKYTLDALEEEERKGKAFVALDLYVAVPGEEELDHMVLIPSNYSSKDTVYPIGKRVGTKWIIDYGQLYEVARGGFSCRLYQKEGRRGKYVSRYYNIFGDRVRSQEMTIWDSDYVERKGGQQEILFVKRFGQQMVVAPDLYGVETCERVLRTEAQIRANIDSYFSIERIPMEDACVWKEMKEGAEFVFLYERGLEPKEYPECYQKLAYQTAYLKHYYPEYYGFVILGYDGKEPWIDDTEKVCEELSIQILPPDLNHSELEPAIQNGMVYQGLRSAYLGAETGIEREKMEPFLMKLVRERKKHGTYRSTKNLIERLCGKNPFYAVDLEALSRSFSINLPDGSTEDLHYAVFAAGYNYAEILENQYQTELERRKVGESV